MKNARLILGVILTLFSWSISYAGIFLGDQILDPSSLKSGSIISVRVGDRIGGTPDVPEYKWLGSLSDSMVWTNAFFESPTDPYIGFELVESDVKIKGKTAYYLKNTSNEKYLSYVFLEDFIDEDGDTINSVTEQDGKIDAQCRLIYTSDMDVASPFVIVSASEGIDWGVNGSYSGAGQPLSTNMMLFTLCKEYKEKELLLALNYAYSNPWVASYVDWGAWLDVFSAEVIMNYIDDLKVLYNKVAELNYIGGTGPGTYDEKLVQVFNTAREEANAAINVISPDEETCKKALDKLESAWLDLACSRENPVVSGYYKFRNSQSTDNDIKMLNAVPGQVTWINWNHNGADPSCVWEVIDRMDGTFLLRNIATNEYVNGKGEASSSGSLSITTGKDSTDNAVLFTSLGGGQFNIQHINTSPLHAEWVTTGGTGAGGNVVEWNSGYNTASAWIFETLSKDSLEYYKQLGEQTALDLQFHDLLKLCLSKYNMGATYDYLLTDSLIESADQIWSNAAHFSTDEMTNNKGVWGTGAAGGGYPAMIDGDRNTYFHSTYDGNAPVSGYHFLQFDLSAEPVKTFLFRYVTRQGMEPADKCRPTTVEIFATNDTTGDTQWRKVADIENLECINSETVSPGISMDQAYKYIRIVVKSTNTGDKAGKYPFFYVSEFQLYKAALDANCQNAKIPEQAEALLNAINNAYLVESGKTTLGDIQRLQDAFDNYMAVFADPTELKSAYSNALTVYNQSVSESTETVTGDKIYKDPGTYSDADKESFKKDLDKVAEYISTCDKNGSYTLEGISSQIQHLSEAIELFRRKMRWINAVDHDDEGTWYHIATSNRYWQVTGSAQTNMRQGILYVDKGEYADKSVIKWTTKDSLISAGLDLDYATWRFINLGDTAYAIQNKATQLYIGQEVTHPAYLTASPVAFKLHEIGYGSFLFEGRFLDGQLVDGVYLHSETQTNKNGRAVYYPSEELGSGSIWDIYTTDEERSEEGVLVENYEPVEFVYTRLQAGKLYAMCYPVDIEYIYDSYDERAIPTYGVTSIEDNKLILSPVSYIEAGCPFFYLAGNDRSLLKPNPTSNDSVMVTIKFADYKNISKNPLTVNGLVGSYYNHTKIPAGMGYLKEILKGTDGAYSERTQVIEPTVKDQTIGWNTAYINAGLVVNGSPSESSVIVDINESLTSVNNLVVDDLFKDKVDVYSIDGVLLKRNVNVNNATNGLSKGVYIVSGKKIIVD